MKRPKTSKIVVYTIVEDTIHGLLWVPNRFLCAGSCPCAYTLIELNLRSSQKKWGVGRTNRIKDLVGMHDGRFMFDYKKI